MSTKSSPPRQKKRGMRPIETSDVDRKRHRITATKSPQDATTTAPKHAMNRHPPKPRSR